jgi:hypothetical protein
VIVAAPLALRQGADHPTLATGDQTAHFRPEIARSCLPLPLV